MSCFHFGFHLLHKYMYFINKILLNKLRIKYIIMYILCFSLVDVFVMWNVFYLLYYCRTHGLRSWLEEAYPQLKFTTSRQRSQKVWLCFLGPTCWKALRLRAFYYPCLRSCLLALLKILHHALPHCENRGYSRCYQLFLRLLKPDDL